jgi:DNA modification methylase
MIPWAKIIIGDSRKMVEIKDESIDLIVTSPPYWHIKDYGKVGKLDTVKHFKELNKTGTR